MTAPPLVVVAGPTGTGKSAMSLDIAARLSSRGVTAEIVNSDAMQLYRGMDIGTAKLPLTERQGVPHHLLDVLDVTETSSVADYQRQAREVVADIRARGAVPILVGGSGLYISALMHAFEFPGTDARIRQRLEAELQASDAAGMWKRLAAVDPEAARSIDAANGRRIVRALEVIELTEKPYSANLPENAGYWVPTLLLLLDVDDSRRGALKERLAARARSMFDAGLVDEVRALLPLGLAQGPTASRAIGYAQAIEVVRGRLDVDAAVEQTTALTHRYVRRQRSWFARYDDAIRLDADHAAVGSRAWAAVESRLEA